MTKSVLTTLKEAVDNALDACEEEGILPDVFVEIEKVGTGSHKGADQIRVRVTDNGPGIDPEDLPKVFGEYLASSKFGKGRCSRGQQGIGISAATTWAQLTSAQGARVITKTANMRKAISCLVEVDIKANKGNLKDRQTLDSWDRPHGTSVEFLFDGRIQVNGEAGLMSYLNGTVLVNPHLTLKYKLPEAEVVKLDRVGQTVPSIPRATEPHPHTMKLGEFIAHSHLFGKMKTGAWLRKGFSRISDLVITEMKKVEGMNKALLERNCDQLSEHDFKLLFSVIQKVELKAPSTSSVLSIGEEGLAKSIKRLGAIDFFSVVSRRPKICDFKPMQVEVAMARLLEKTPGEHEEPVQVLRFANRVPLQFDKAGCAIVQAINTVNWRSYGLNQPKDSLPLGPYIIAVSVVSPFIKFKNASKETVDSSEELVEEIRRALIQAGQRLSRHIKREDKANELEEKIKHIEQFGPILIDGLCRITASAPARKKRAEDGLIKLLGREAKEAEKEFKEVQEAHSHQVSKDKALLHVEDTGEDEGSDDDDSGAPVQRELALESKKGKNASPPTKAKKSSSKTPGKKKEINEVIA